MSLERRKDSGHHPTIVDLEESLLVWVLRVLEYRSLMTVIDTSSLVGAQLGRAL